MEILYLGDSDHRNFGIVNDKRGNFSPHIEIIAFAG